jgi:hypothetical protein
MQLVAAEEESDRLESLHNIHRQQHQHYRLQQQ